MLNVAGATIFTCLASCIPSFVACLDQDGRICFGVITLGRVWKLYGTRWMIDRRNVRPVLPIYVP